MAGVSNLFERRAKCTNFKLVGDQTTEAPKGPRSKCRRHRGGMEWGGGVVPLPTRVSGGGVCGRALAENEFWHILPLEKHKSINGRCLFNCDKIRETSQAG